MLTDVFQSFVWTDLIPQALNPKPRGIKQAERCGCYAVLPRCQDEDRTDDIDKDSKVLDLL